MTLFLLLLLIGVGVFVTRAYRRAAARSLTVPEQVVIDLYTVRVGFELAWFQMQLHRDAARARRKLTDELDPLAQLRVIRLSERE